MSEYLDTRDLSERLDELEAERDDLENAIEEADEEDREEARAALQEFDESEEAAELVELRTLRSEVTEWEHGNTLIPEDSFTDYVEEMLKDCGDLPRDIPWYITIDWEQTAENIKADYGECEYQGETYLYRA